MSTDGKPAQGPELRALAEALDHAGWSGLEYTEAERLLIISALERAASAEGEKAEGRYPTPRADSMSSSVQPMPDPYRSAS